MDLTAFPNLHSTQLPAHAGAALAEEILAGLPQLQDEVILRAWAALLRAYTGADAVRFLVDDAAVEVGATISTLAPPQPASDLANVTRVCINSTPSAHPPQALTFQYDRDAAWGRLISSAYLPVHHLRHMASQLRRCIAQAHAPSESSPPVSLSVLNPHPAALEGPRLLHHLVQWTDHSARPAIDYLGADGKRAELSYSALDRLTTSLASIILSHLTPSRPHPVVPLLVPQSPELYVAQLAILKAGGAFCPLNLDAPPERVKFIIQDVSARLVITTPSLRDKIPPASNVHVLLLEDGCSNLDSADCADFPDPSPEDLAYVMYTSGSTGTPKGVGVSHSAATQSLLAHDRHIPSFSRFLQFAAPTFDVSVFEIFFPLFRGCTLVTCDRTVLLNDLPAAMRTLEVDGAELTPTVAGTLLQTRSAVPKLKLLLTIGEMLSTQIVQEFGGNEGRPSILWGMYGPTEAAIHCTLQPSFSAQSKVGNIGVPLDTVSAFIVAPPPEDQSIPAPMEILPIGQVGELAVGGHQLAVGYLNRPEQTAAAFVDHPEYGRLYRTGDKARLLPDGTLECLGRISSGQVKLRGQRVELGEVEQALTNIKGCRSVTASVISGILVAFVLAQDRSLTAQQVIEESKRWLPAFMVPGDVVILDDIPRLPSGKVDRKTLEATYRDQQGTERPVRTEHADETERRICTILTSVLQETVHPTSNLAALGLDSLKAIRVASALRLSDYSLGAVDVLSARDAQSLRLLLKDRSIATGLSSSSNGTFKDLKQAVLNLNEVRRHISDVEDVLGCTPLQAAMLAETSINPRAYCNWIELEIHQECSASQLKGWLTELAKKNNILRSGFCSLTGSTHSYAQIIWSALSDSQMVEVDEFEKNYELSSPESLLRPLKFQILTSTSRPRILCQIPHALYDGWSMDLIVFDLNTLISGGEIPARPQFRDVAVHFATTSATDLEPSLNYWKKQLESYTYAPVPNFNGRNVHANTLAVTGRALSTPLEHLRHQASTIKVNTQVFFQAALAVLASFYFNNNDITFGTVTSGRTIPVSGIEEIIGPCIATLPLRLDVSRSRTVKDLLLQIHELNRAMLSHCELPLRDVKKACGLAPGSPLFDMLFVWQESLQSSENRDSLVSQVDGADQLEFRLTLEFEPRATGVVSKATYDPDVLPKAQVDIIISQIEQLVGFFSQNVDMELTQSIQRMDHSVLSIENADFKHEEILEGPSHAVETKAEQCPDAPAIAFSSNITEGGIQTQTMSYRQLNERANQLAGLLLSHGVGPEELVCICMEKSTDLYVSILATLKVGSGYVPITPETPLERIRFILDEAKVRICLTRSDCLADIRSLGERDVLDVDKVNLDGFSTENPNVPYDGSRVAYAVFTSGSTGTPKGVLVTQDNLVSNLKVLSEIYPCPEGSRLLQSCSQAFDVSVFEIFFSWYAGMCLCSGTKDELFQDMELAIRQMGITHLSFTPTVAALVNPDNVPNVKFLVTAGEAVTEHVKRTWAGKGLYQGYGPSETTNICTVRPRVTEDDLINNIGAPFTNTSAFVMDETRDILIPRGGIGELCFGGDQVFRGYLNMPELTAKKIIDHPTWGRIYRSGDMGRLCPDGSILFTGRTDDQVKLRGQRIELGEINSCILDSASVTDCVTLLMGIQNRTAQQLVSFWVPLGFSSPDTQVVPIEDKTQKTVAEVFSNLANKLPAYMLPNALVPVTSIPMTTQGKTDKRKLTALYEQLTPDYIDLVSRKSEELDETGDWSELESAIANILASVLKMPTDEIKRQASFFAYGLDSISAISLSNGLKEANLPRIPVSAILQNATIVRLARFISEKTSGSDVRPQAVDPTTVFSDSTREQILSAFSDEKIRVSKILPCSPLQEAMLSAGGASETATYLNKMVFKVRGDHARLRECWTAMCKRHEILRTCFIATEDHRYAFAQIVLEESAPHWDEIDANDAELDARINEYVESIVASMAESTLPPLRFATIQTENSSYLLFCCHHALYDGAAMGQLMTEVEQMYRGNDLPPVSSFDQFLAEMIQVRSEETDAFWSGRLQSLEPTSFPDLTGLSAAARKTRTRRSVFVENLPLSLSTLESDCRKLSCTLLALCQAAWAKILSLYTGESDVCFGNVVSGRTLPIDGLDRLVAPCFNTLPVRVDLSAKSKNCDLLAYLSSFNADSLPYQLTPLRRIQAKLSGDGTRLFDTLFILQQSTYSLDENIWSLEEDSGEMDFPLVCELVPDRHNDTLALVLHFHEAFIAKEDIRVIHDTYAATLKACTQDPSSHHFDATHLPEGLLSTSNLDFKTIEPPAGPLLHSAFERNAEEIPHAVALDFQHADGSRGRWTFNELNQISNQIAHALLQHGVGFDEAVPICMPKSPHYYASVLAVLKAGAAFTPIDVNLPVSRKQFMLQELGAKVVISNAMIDTHWCGKTQILFVETIGSSSTHNPNVTGLRPDHLAYRLYTSGSTGTPKAVSVEHRNPVQTVEASRTIIPWSPESRLLQFAATTFDMCYYDCFLAWSFGFTLCAAEQPMMLNDTPGIIDSMQVTLADLTPSVALSLPQDAVPTLQYLYCIGEAMPQELVDRWAGKLVNSYGPTEAAFCVTIFPVSKDIKSAVIGKPFPTTSFIVQSRDGLSTLPVFGVGELYIGGSQVAREYHANHEMTQTRFVSCHDQRFYKSGDVVRMLGNGTFEFVGRADDQVKIRGLRVELGEISAVLRDSHDAITTVSTQVLKASESSKDQIVAFLAVGSDKDNLDADEIKNKAKKSAADKLPSYMVPNFLILVDRIPLSAAGKVDKRTLKTIFQDSEEARQETAEVHDERDWTPTELEIREALASLSKVAPGSIGLQTTIYQLGLDSISAVQVAARLRKRGFKVTASDVLDRPTCAELALLLQSGGSHVSNEQNFDFKGFEERHLQNISRDLGINADDIAAVHPCTPLQAGMISQFLHSEGKMYLNYMQYRFENISLDSLEQALRLLYEKHEILRSGFVHVNSTQSPFALVTYAHDASLAPVSMMEESESVEAKVLEWREDSRRDILRGLHKNAFRALLIDSTDGVSLHLSILHSLYDALSLRILLDEVTAFCLDGKVPAPKPFQPILSSILLSSSDESEERKHFWEEKGNDVFVNAFPSMTPLRVKEGRTLVSSKTCSQSQTQLEAGCRKTGITVQAAGQAAWTRLLSAYIGEDAATFGVVFSGRNDESAEEIAFPCITTVPLPARNNPSNRALLNSMMAFTTTVRKHQFTPLTKIQRWTGHPDEALFDTIFAYQKLSSGSSRKTHWKLVDEDATVDAAVSIELEPTDGDQLELRITYRSDRLPEEQAKVMLDQLDQILVDLIFHPDGQVEDAFQKSQELLSITPPKEREIQTDVSLLHEFVERSARQHPDKIAFEFATEIEDMKVTSRCWTYKELDEEGNKIANLLKSNGVEPGGLVAICFDKCPEASFGILGILKAGCAYVALDPGAPVARKAFITHDSKASMVVSMKSQTEPLQGQVSVPIINLDEVDYSKLSAGKPELSRSITPQDLSYCLYTSGTTGTPKGCELTHENAVQAMLAFSRLFYPRWDADSKWLQFASFHFDVSVLEQYWTWSEGIRLVSAPRDLIFEDLAGSITALGITHIDLTPSLAKQLTPDQVPTLLKGVFITGGEALKQEILDDFGRYEVIHNGYGPTEATIGVTMFPRVPANGKPSNIGPQFDNVGSFVFRPNTSIPVMRGAVGELCVSGKLVGKGYLNRPDLTNEKFPYLDEFGEKVYRTGDLVRILHDGSFDFLGRADDQVKLRGQRLEIGEINSVINQSEAEVLDVATLVLKHPKQQKDQLVSFIVTKSTLVKKQKPAVSQGGKDAMQVAAEACRSKLSAYMVPTHFIPLTSMPLSPNNKADGKHLKQLYSELSPEQLQSISTSSGDGGAISTADEKKVAEVLASMASVDGSDISRSSSIFELGLDSISVIGFAGALRKAGFRNAQASVVMKNPVLSRLAKALSSKDSGADRASIQAAKQTISACQHQYKAIASRSLGVQQNAIEGIAPCSPLQQGIISRSLESDKPVYFATFRFELSPDVDLSKLQAAWEKAYRSIQILRARFIPTDNGYIQVVLRDQPLPWVETSVTNPEEVEEYLDTRKLKWWSQNRDKLMRPFELVTTVSPGKKILSVHIMHVLYDGASLPMLLQAVEAEYKGSQQVDFGPAFLEVLPYGPLRNMPEAKSFWTAHLSTARSCIMRGLTSSPQDQDITVSGTLEALGSFESTRRKLDVTHQALVQACWTSVLQKHFDGAVTLGMVVSGRSIDFEGADRTIGPMFNTIPFHINFTQDDTWSQVVRRCHEFNTSALPYQHTPLRDIMKWSKRAPSEPLFDTLFVFQKELEDGEPDKSLWSLLEDQPEADYPLALEVEQKQNGSLGLTIVAQGQIADREALVALLSEFRTALQNLLENPEALVSGTVGEIHSVSPAYVNGVNGHANGHLNGVEGFEWTPVARRLQEEIATLAGIEPSEVDEHTTIFELGLDSIDAIKLSSRLKKSGINLPVSQIMRSLTIPRMTNEVTEKTADSQAVTPGATLDSQQAKLTEHFRNVGGKYLENVERILPATPLQEAMVAEMLSSEFHHYFNHDVLKLASGVDIEKMKQAWVGVYRSSAVLRTTFEEVDDPDLDMSFAQVVHKPEGFIVGEIEAASPDDIDTIVNRIRSQTAEHGGKADLFQVNIIRCKSEVYLVLSIAHALYDGWSLGLLHNDVQAAYAGDVNARPAYDHVLEDILNASGEKAATFWRDFLGGAPSGLLSEGRVQDLSTGLQVHRKEHTGSVSVETLRAFCKNAGITLQALGQTCWSLVLASYLGRLDLVFGVVLSGRDSHEAEDVMFPTMNTVAVRSIIHGTRKDMLRYMQENISTMRQFQHYPLRKAKAAAETNGKSLFDTLFIFQTRPGDDDQGASEALYESVGGAADVEYPVAVEMEAVGDNLVWRTACKSNVFDEEGSQQLLNRVDAVMKGIISSPDAGVVSYGDDGASVCGLPPFRDQSAENSDAEEDRALTNGTSASTEWTKSEKMIREVLSAVSKVPELDITKDLTIFHLGLDSISAIKVSSLLKKKSIKLSVSEMLRAATVEKMAQVIESRKSSATTAPDADPAKVLTGILHPLNVEGLLNDAKISPEDVEQVIPATSGQTFMLSVWQKTEGSLLFPSFKYHIKDAVDEERLREAWAALVSANPILRTMLVATGSKETPFIQVVLKQSEQGFQAINAYTPTSSPKKVQKKRSSSRTRSLIRKVSQKFKNVLGRHSEGEREPLQSWEPMPSNIRQPFAKLVANKQHDGWLLTIKLHHALYDGVSLPILMQQYEALCNQPSAKPNPPAAFPALIAASASADAASKAEAFWSSYLKEAAAPAAKLLQQPRSARPGRVSVFKPDICDSVAALEAAAMKQGLNVQSLFLAAYARLYAGLVGHNDGGDQGVVFGIWLANRSHAIDGLAEVAAPTVNLVPLRVRGPLGRRSVFEIAREVQEDLRSIGSVENAGAGLWQIERWTGVKVDSFVNFLKLPESGEEAAGKSEAGVKVREVENEEMKGGWSRVEKSEDGPFEVPAELKNNVVGDAYLHSLDVEATTRGGRLDMGVFCNVELLDLAKAEQLVNDMAEEFKAMME
ncbi:Hydroxamate-type ferrichrome siderophore peptide synthetase [Lasiodiplodia hormozganensis]|uniref:Hydroxamate-type ferrichrome siderophore peptide synthetase n=1 Tax=Lasiodiplodia hormozganensis TaxID=869390 RepID=A0AA39Z1B6_9PEZI|nr:Hydroxamate-type ferrichrome siderophore peptide synthetase [Lasiodiplodia hormozganensis]